MGDVRTTLTTAKPSESTDQGIQKENQIKRVPKPTKGKSKTDKPSMKIGAIKTSSLIKTMSERPQTEIKSRAK
jgi:NADPH-dependent glutamate synthase beta subunit-like oxidoreductase